MNSKIKGYLLGAAAAASYGLNPTFALPLYADGMNPDSVLLLRYGFAMVIVAFMIVMRGRSFKVPKGSIVALMALGVMMTMSSLTLFESYQYMAAGIASTILFVYPIMVAVIMAVFFKEKLKLTTVACILTAACGIMLLYNTGSGTTLSLVGTVLVIVSALSYALYLVGVNSRRIAGIATLTVTFYVLCTGTALFAGKIAVAGELTLPTKWYMWLDALALAAIPTTVSLFCTTAAIQLVGSTPTAILGALEPLTAVIMGILLFGESMTGREAAGIVLILLAVTFVIAGGAGAGSSLSRHLTRIRHMFPKLKRR